jgi:hypothetical protein
MPEANVIFAGVSLLIVYTVTILGGATWLNNKFQAMKNEIIADFNAKHASNAETVKALEVLVIRHDTMLNPEWRSESYHRQRMHNGN